MKALETIKNHPVIAVLSNKYVWSTLLFAVWMTFLDTNSYLIHRELDTEIEKLDKGISYYQEQITLQVKRLEDVETQPEALERFARETYWMHRPGEEVVLIENTVSID